MLTESFFARNEDAKAFFRAYGSFGEMSGEIKRDGNKLYYENSEYKIECEYEKDEYGVFTRKDVFLNKSDKDINLRCLKSRFVFEGGEYEVYTQFNNWQTESVGSWQPLVTSVSVESASLRTASSGTPFMVLWNNQTNRGVAFHLMPKSAWEIKVSRVRKYARHSVIVVEMGISDYNLDLDLKAGAKLEMPEIICYEVRNKLDMDCYKLHNYMHTKYPRREMPVIFDTWMYKFDYIDYENVASQIELAANLGVEYFFIDAGWFGKGGGWSGSVGDWSENTQTKFAGRMIDVANKVREYGMKFGLWIEPERAAPTSDSVRDHKEFFMKGDVEANCCFLDFANPDAREWMLEVLDGLIEKYGVKYIKDDFNADMYFDPRNSAYLKYHEGHAEFIKELRKRHPDLYLSCCAAGGLRLELKNYTEFDSSWPSDNESPYSEMRIYKDTILRMPPQSMERWVVVHSITNMESFYEPFKDYNDGEVERLVACSDATWHRVEGVQPSFMEGYMTAGPIGFSCDLSKISPKMTERFKNFILKIKENREFFKKAVARILIDTKSVTAYQYSDMELSKVEIQLFLHEPMQQCFTVIPVLNENKKYSINGEIKSGKELMDEGISLEVPAWIDNWHHMHRVELSEI